MSPAPALRALFVALEEWVTKGIAPPPSRVPSISAGTAVEDADVACRRSRVLPCRTAAT